ncbi:hypothetical protein COCSUDRAFT_41763 [Coccomyxa subellipsoidea C-169]|uniref:Uncharacterized protein n=1 Tax=Coccomyxa subellipsoidea (strain C-169) TaxID=574566 RepID=I0YYT7_COCSC|nr:hypothetical protein COCSUDRAFT_41763 [Coccomyxa subellipsoidea C-169]EIE23556.1 hypothetical protein COCSUDRAFT_41763 [Coccomyxa subellipsoidea C-169]|eukprot:XP_005648100.1 hypothetical protein COCSUDRAFT_41763 [Coccomyxa subellipsoidea C-169]
MALELLGSILLEESYLQLCNGGYLVGSGSYINSSDHEALNSKRMETTGMFGFAERDEETAFLALLNALDAAPDKVEKRQGEFERLRAAALDCMKQMLDLLMRSDGVLAAVTPLQKLLVDDMKGSSAGSLCPGQAASPVTPAHSAPSTPRGKLPATHQVLTAALQSNDEEFIGAAFESLQVLAEALISSKLVAGSEPRKIALSNPILVMLRKKNLSVKKVLMLYCTKILEIPGIFTNAECQETSVSAVLHVFAQSAMTTASHHPQDKSPVPVMHLQALLKSLKHHFRATADLAFSRQSTKGDQGSAGVRQQGSAATFTFSLVAHSLGYHLANTEEFEDSPDAAGSALQDACGALLLPISHWAGLASRVASEATAAVQNTSCTGNKDAKSVLAGNSEEGVCDLTDSPPRAEAAADAAVTPENSRPSGGGGAERGPGSEAGGALLENEAADIEQAWQALLDGMLAVAARKRSFKKEYCGDTARRITGIADRLPVNHTALACLQLASCAAHALTRQGWRESQVQKSLPGKHAVDSAQLRRERLDVLRMLGVLLQQLLKHIERDASLAAACAAQVIKALAGLLRHAWEDFKVLDMLKLLEPLGAWLKETGSSTAADLGGALRSCWGEMLSAVAVQEQPQKSLAVALAHRPAYAKDMLRPLCNGFTHDCAQIRAASLELWQNPKIQCALGKHLAGLPPFVNESLARAQELGFASQPSQPAAKQQPHKAPRALLKQAEPPTVAAPQAKDPQQEPPTTVAPPAEDPQQGPDAPDAPAPVAEPKKRPSNRLFQDTQTEYVRIESAGKRHRKNLLTDHQREVAARHRLGVGREGVTTFTRLDISQDAFSLINNSNTLDSVGNTCSAAADGGKGGPTVGHCHGSEEAANVNDSSVMEPVNGHAETSEAQLQASEGAVHPSGAADQAGLRASSSQAPMDMEAQEEAAKQDATANQRGSKSLQEAPVAGQDITQSSSQQERAQSPGTAAAVSPRGAQATGISQQQGQSPVQSTPHASVAVAESERGTDTSQKLSKGKENSGRARRLPHDQRQQQHWRKRRKAAQPVDQALPAATEPPGMHTSAAAETLQEDVSPDAQQPGSDAAVPAAAAGSSVEHVTAPAQPVEQPGTQQEQQQQPGSSAAQMQCSDSAQHGPDSANCMGAGDGISGVPAEAQTDHDAACADDMMQSTVPDSDHEGGAEPEAGPAGAPPVEETPAAPLPMSEADVQELQLTGLTQQLGQTAKLDKWTVKHTLHRMERMLAESLKDLESTVQSVMPDIKSVEAGERIGLLQQLDKLQQALIKGAGKLGDVRSQLYTD